MIQPKILVVDDDSQLRRLMTLILQRAGYQVITAVSGGKGVEKVRTEKPDLVLMDVMMPGMDGFEATRHIRRSREGRHLPIIFLSAKDEMDAKVRGLREGGNDYVTKPVKVGELLARIEVQLRAEAPILGQLITVFGSKANVGCTTLVVNLALALRQVSQQDILLVDWQRPLGDVALFLGLPKVRMMESLLPHITDLNTRTFGKALRMLNEVVNECLPGVWVIPGATSLDTAKQMDRKVLDNLLELALIKGDYVLVDAGAFFSWEDPPLIDVGEGINLCVLTPDPTSIERAALAMESINAMEHDFWLILNRYDTPGVPPGQIVSRLGTTLKGRVPDVSEQAMQALNEGRPLYMTDPDSGFSRAIHDIATRLHEALTL